MRNTYTKVTLFDDIYIFFYQYFSHIIKYQMDYIHYTLRNIKMF